MGYRSVFDGYSLTLYRPDGSIVGSWPAISGRDGKQRPSDQNLAFVGPLTEGRYSVSSDSIQPMTTFDAMAGLVPGHGRFPGSVVAWGSERAPLVPESTSTNGRGHFFIHGGLVPGSAGCIDLGPNEKAYFDALRATGESTHDVVVRYDPKLETSHHPLAGTRVWNGTGEYLTRSLPGLFSAPHSDPESPSDSKVLPGGRKDLDGGSLNPVPEVPSNLFVDRFESSTKSLHPNQPSQGPGSNGAGTRILARRVVGKSQAPGPVVEPPAVPDGSFSDRFSNCTVTPEGAIAPRNPNLPVPSPESDRPLGIATGKPVPLWITPPPIFGFPDRRHALGPGPATSIAPAAATEGAASRMTAPSLESSSPLLDYLRRLRESNGQSPQ